MPNTVCPHGALHCENVMISADLNPTGCSPVTAAPRGFAPFVRLGARLAALAGWRRNLLLFLAGTFGTLALAPFYFWGLLPPAFTLFFWCGMTASRPRRAFFDGWWFGFGFFTTGLYWFACALLVDAAQFAWLIPFAVFGLSALFALYTGLAGMGFYAARRIDRAAWPVFAASLWTTTEWIRGYLFTGFPWNKIGDAFTASDAAMQPAAWIGATGLSWLAVALSVLPACYLLPMRSVAQGRRWIAVYFLVLGLCALIFAGGVHRLRSHATAYQESAAFRLVQGGVPQTMKLDPNARLRAVQTYAELTMQPGYDKARYIVWSETSMTFPFTSGDEWAKRLAMLAPKNGLLFTGVVRIESAPEGARQPVFLFNSLQTIDPGGHVVFSYDKRKLVPFGEFLPFRGLVPFGKITPGSLDFSVGAGPGHFALPNGDGTIFPQICYEVIFPELSENAWPSAILNITNDTWFGDSTGPYQHLSMARLRAVEQGVPLLRDANSGISAVIDPYGRILKFLPLDAVGLIDTALPKSVSAPTFYGLYGAQTLVVLLMISYIATFCAGVTRKNIDISDQ